MQFALSKCLQCKTVNLKQNNIIKYRISWIDLLRALFILFLKGEMIYELWYLHFCSTCYGMILMGVSYLCKTIFEYLMSIMLLKKLLIFMNSSWVDVKFVELCKY